MGIMACRARARTRSAVCHVPTWAEYPSGQGGDARRSPPSPGNSSAAVAGRGQAAVLSAIVGAATGSTCPAHNKASAAATYLSAWTLTERASYRKAALGHETVPPFRTRARQAAMPAVALRGAPLSHVRPHSSAQTRLNEAALRAGFARRGLRLPACYHR